MSDVARVGGKNASLGELISRLSSAGIQVPGGFAVTSCAYHNFLAESSLAERINALLDNLDAEDLQQLTRAGATVRGWLLKAPLPRELERAIRDAYGRLSSSGDVSVAVRSSATAEDLPEASFAGQQETFLNVCGIDNVLVAVRKVFASLFNDRAIAYRTHQGYAHAEVALSVGIQRMIRSDLGASGVIFTLDTESGYSDAVFITASWGWANALYRGQSTRMNFTCTNPRWLRKDPPFCAARSAAKQSK